jgi:N-carbamoyl-L-amino-acid hydrolase
MNMRHDAMVATSDVVQAVRRITATEGTDLVGTVGSVDVWPNAINVIPETVEFTVDFRSYDDEVVDEAVERIQQEIEWAAEREGLEYEFEEIMRVDADPFHQECIDTVVASAEDLGHDYTRLVSGAGHDANYLNKICPSSMIFVPSVDGISHRESEYTEWEDIVVGTEILLEAVQRRAAE